MCFGRKNVAEINPLALELDIYSLAHQLCKMWIFYELSSVKLGIGINEDGERKSKKKINIIVD